MNRLARLTRIHAQQQRKVELAELTHAGSLAEVGRAEAAARAAQRAWDELASQAQFASIAALEEGRERLAQAQRTWKQAEQQLARSNAKKAQTMEAVRGATVEAKKLETLCESTAVLLREQADRIEARAFDELAARRARR